MPPLIELDAVSFRYRRAAEPAIRDLSLTVEPGEVLLIAGPSGCGKSTVIRTINGLIPPAYTGDLQGQVRLEGQATTDLRLREDTIDAMDLRGFGTQRRTWLRQLALDATDRLVLVFFAGLLAAVTALSFAGLTQLWVPQLLIDLARG